MKRIPLESDGLASDVGCCDVVFIEERPFVRWRLRSALILFSSFLACLALGSSASLLAEAANGEHEQRSSTGAIDSVALAPPTPAPDGGKRFEKMSADRTSVTFVHQWTPPDRYKANVDRSSAGGGTAIGDYDGDGRADIYLSRPFGGGRLYRNLGDFRFEDATTQAGLAGDTAWGAGCSFVDIDGDGDLDLYVCGFDCPNRLFINQGNGTFREQAKDFGLDFNGSSITMAFADYDNDGDMDGYLVTNRPYVSQEMATLTKKAIGAQLIRRGKQLYMPEKYRDFIDLLPRPTGKFVLITAGQIDHLFRNNGDGTFTDVSEQAGMSGHDMGLSATWWDYNEDGYPDLYVANDFYGPDRLYRNNRDGTFTDVIAVSIPHTPWYSMGVDVADINNDGRLDLFSSDMSGTTHYKQKLAMGDMESQGWFLEFGQPRQYMRNALYLNTGADRFMEAAQMAGLPNSDWTWSPKFADFDNDGWVDLFISNGMTGDYFNADLMAANRHQDKEHKKTPPLKRDTNLAMKNLGDLQFQSVASEWGLDHTGVSFGAAVADLDGDGHLDLVVNNFEQEASVYRNHGREVERRVMLRLKGTVGNRFGIGALVRIETTAGLQVRYLSLASGFASANEPLVHFGLGEVNAIDKLTVRWPSGAVQTFESLPADHFYTITEPTAAPTSMTHSTAAPQTIFVRSDRLPSIRHRETPYDDFAREPLLPNKLSQLGPCLAMGDIDDDGHDDLFVGGAAGQRGRLYVRRGERFEPHNDPLLSGADEPFHGDRASEDMGALFFDVEGDGDLDLYVVSGGVECEPQAQVLADRLYINDGRGQFSKASESQLPEVRDSGSCVVAADFDRDGDLDLFVGSRVVPGQYPLAPHSRLLRNDSADAQPRLTDVTDALAPGLQTTGLVTGAIWSDADGDGWLDLLVTHEWGPVKFYRNAQGRLVDQTAAAGLAERLGWCNGVSAGDVDRDGDVDYVVTNFGHNTKYHPTPEHPAAIYYGDFDGSGRRQIVEAKKQDENYLPVRGKSCSQNAMPFLSDKFPTYHDFALAGLEEIYTPKLLEESLHLEVNSLASGVLLNDGQGHFTFEPLPRLAQIAPSFGSALVDINGDGRLDLVLAQNFFGPQRETGRMDGGLSLLLMGDGHGRFEPVWPSASGIIVPQAATSLVATHLDDDNRPDLLLGVNDGELIAYENRLDVAHEHLRVRLVGQSPNPQAIGARVLLGLSDGAQQIAEVHAGGGYLSQASPTLTFGLGDAQPTQLVIRWPTGRTTTHDLHHQRERHDAVIVINQPASQ